MLDQSRLANLPRPENYPDFVAKKNPLQRFS